LHDNVFAPTTSNENQGSPKIHPKSMLQRNNDPPLEPYI
jgi:hypothetical protein